MSNDIKSFSAISLGCRVNRAEIDDFSAHLIEIGMTMQDIENADLIVVNTCTVTAIAEKKTRKTIRKICKYNAKHILITGCAACLEEEFYCSIDPRIQVVNKTSFLDFSYKNISKILSGPNFRTRTSIKIQDGCDNACTYCIVHVARGKSKSINPDDIIYRYEQFCKAKIKEVVLAGVNLGAYEYGLTNLLKKLNGPARIRLSSIEPNNVSDTLINYLKDSNVARFLHIPLQSGSDRILKLMDRHYSATNYLNLVKKIKSEIPSISLSTDVIVGFPSETNQDFKDTINLCKECKFMKIHVFPYSSRPNTPAAYMDDQISPKVKNQRAKTLRILSDELAEEDLLFRKNTKELALVESKNIARTESYHIIKPPKDAKIGSLVEVVL